MSWFLYSMADNPQYQNRVFAELDDIFGTSERHCTFDDLSKMKYLDCCIKETLRLYPSTGMIERKINKPYQLGNVRQKQISFNFGRPFKRLRLQANT